MLRTRSPSPATNPSDDRNRSNGKGRRSLRTDDAKRSSLQNRAGHRAITTLQFLNSSLRFDPFHARHEMAGRVHLLFRRQLGLLADGSVKNSGIGAGDEESGGAAVSVVLDFTRRWIGSVFGVAAGPQRGFVQHTAAIQVQDEDRRFGGDGVDFIKRGHTPFGELELAPTADDADPLTGWCPLRLLLQYAQSIRERG